jgi:hypothetical protein
VHWAGKIVIAMGPVSLLLFLLVPLAMVVVLFGVIPVGNPFERFDMSTKNASAPVLFVDESRSMDGANGGAVAQASKRSLCL